MAYGYSTIFIRNDGTVLIQDQYYWQIPTSGGQQYRVYLRDPADGIPPPDTYSAHHNQMIAIKNEDWDVEEDEEGFHEWPGGSIDAVNSVADNLDASDRMDYQAGHLSLEYMDLVGLGDWARKHSDNFATTFAQVILEGERQRPVRVPRYSVPGNRIEVTEELMELRHERNEERLYDLYLRRRREERDRREQRDF